MSKIAFNKNLVLLVVSSLIIVLLMTLCFFRIRHFNETSKLIRIGTQALEGKQKRLSKLKALDSIRPELEYAFKDLQLKIPQLPLEHELVDQIELLASSNGINLNQVQFNERVENNNVNEIQFTFSITGRYSSLISLLQNISTGERLIRVDEIQIVKDENVKDTIRADITAAAFSNIVAK